MVVNLEYFHYVPFLGEYLYFRTIMCLSYLELFDKPRNAGLANNCGLCCGTFYSNYARKIRNAIIKK